LFIINKNSADIALVGLAVMGQNLILNMNDHGFKVNLFVYLWIVCEKIKKTSNLGLRF